MENDFEIHQGLHPEPIADVVHPEVDIHPEPIADVVHPEVDIHPEPIADVVHPEVDIRPEPIADVVHPEVDIRPEPIVLEENDVEMEDVQGDLDQHDDLEEGEEDVEDVFEPEGNHIYIIIIFLPFCPIFFLFVYTHNRTITFFF